MTLAPFHTDSTRAVRQPTPRRPPQPDVMGYTDGPDTAEAVDPADLETRHDADVEVWELEDRYAEPSADPTPNALPRPELDPGETTQTSVDEPGVDREGPTSEPARSRTAPKRRSTPRQRPAVTAARGPQASSQVRRSTAGTWTGRRGRRRRPPVVKLGVLWALGLGLATGFSPPIAALLLVPVTAIAAQSAWRRMDPPVVEPGWLAPVAAGACPLVAIFGPIPGVVAVVSAAVVVAVVTGRGASLGRQIKLGICVAAPAAGSASLIAACSLSPTIGLALLTAVCLFDASNYIMGIGDTGGALGAVAGAASLAVLAIVIAGLFVVPFVADSPWLLCGSVALTAPLSTGLAHGFVGRVRLPAWRRLDSLFLAGPVWVAIALATVAH